SARPRLSSVGANATSEKCPTAIESMRSCECRGALLGALCSTPHRKERRAGPEIFFSLALRLAARFRSRGCRRQSERRGVAQPGRAPGSGPGGRRFKSSLPDQSFQYDIRTFWFFVYIRCRRIRYGGNTPLLL